VLVDWKGPRNLDLYPRTLSLAFIWPHPAAGLRPYFLRLVVQNSVVFLNDIILTEYCDLKAVGPQSLRGIPNGYSSQQQLPQNRSVSSRLPPTGKMGMGPQWLADQDTELC
jgi:hypothetical protein